jgi:hypothetical protein
MEVKSSFSGSCRLEVSVKSKSHPLPRAYHLSLLGMASLFAHLLGQFTKFGVTLALFCHGLRLGRSHDFIRTWSPEFIMWSRENPQYPASESGVGSPSQFMMLSDTGCQGSLEPATE